MKKQLITMLIASAAILQAVAQSETKPEKVFPGADENTPSRSDYFTWLNHKWEGPSQKQSVTNLKFFKWMHDTYGMQLDLYSGLAGSIDSIRYYGSLDTRDTKICFLMVLGRWPKLQGQ